MINGTLVANGRSYRSEQYILEYTWDTRKLTFLECPWLETNNGDNFQTYVLADWFIDRYQSHIWFECLRLIRTALQSHGCPLIYLGRGMFIIPFQLIWQLIELGSDMESFRNKKSSARNRLVLFDKELKTTVQSWQITYSYCNCKSQLKGQHLQAALNSSSLKGLRYNYLYITVRIKQCVVGVSFEAIT